MPAVSTEEARVTAEAELGDRVWLAFGRYTIDFDGLNWTLREWHWKQPTAKDPHPEGLAGKILGYYGGLEFALKSLLNQRLGKSGVRGAAEDMMLAIEEARAEIVNAVERMPYRPARGDERAPSIA